MYSALEALRKRRRRDDTDDEQGKPKEADHDSRRKITINTY